MSDKPVAFLVYALFGLLLAMCPALLAVRQTATAPDKPISPWYKTEPALSAVAAALLILVALISGAQLACIGFSALAATWVAWRTKLLSLTTVLFLCSVLVASSKLVWWAPFGNVMTGVVLALALVAFFVSLEIFIRGRELTPPRAVFERIAILVFVTLCLFLAFSTGLYGSDEILFTTWHHWSSYVGPAELMRAGARVFYDTPAQYGLGPTTIIALGCSVDCWTGMYFIVGAANLLYALTIAYIALRLLGRERTLGMTVVTLAAIVAACFLYTAYPPSVATPSISPSTGGLRFLPCVVMVAYLMHIADTSWTRRHRVLGHVIWAVCLFWAPESAFHVTFVWWPYYLWRYASGSQKGFPAALLITRQMAILMLIAAFVVALFLGAYFAFYSVLPTIDGVFAYILYPPGPIPFDFHGAFDISSARLVWR